MYMKRFIISGIIYLILYSMLFGQGPQDIIKRKIRYGFEINRRPPVNFNIHVNKAIKFLQPVNMSKPIARHC